MYRLTFINGKRRGRSLRIRSKQIKIGSDSKCAVCIGAHGLAPEHAEIDNTDSGLYLRRLSEGGQLKLNGSEIERAILHDGDIIAVGSLRLKFKASKSLPALYGRRRGDGLQVLTLAAVAALLVAELAILFGWSIILRREPKDESSKPPPPTVQAPQTVPKSVEAQEAPEPEQ